MSTTPPPATATSPPATPPARAFGRFALRKLIGKSAGSTVWLAFDPRIDSDVMLTVPRVQPVDALALDLWAREAKRASRLQHPHLAEVLEIGLQDNWPFIVVDRHQGITLAEWLTENDPPLPVDAVAWLVQLLEGLAFAHEAGCTHNDLQLQSILITEQGQAKLMGLSTAGDMSSVEETRYFGGLPPGAEPSVSDTSGLSARRDAAERDVLCVNLLLHRLLTGLPPLEQADTARVVVRMSPLGREIVHLGWSTPHPVPAALRAIANRGTASQDRQRYLNARTLHRALTGWLQTESEDNGGPLALLLDRLRTVGHLPASANLEARVRRLVAMEGKHTDAMVAELLQDMALSVEMLRQVNSAFVRGTQVAGNGAVLTLRRSVALLGVNGIRHAAVGLRKWPGPLDEPAALALRRLMSRVRLAGYVASALRPAGYDPEVTYLVTVMQNLGRLLVQYHFPDEAQQIVQLMAPLDATRPDGQRTTTAGMDESAASFAVLGVDLQDVGAAVARHWGLGPELQIMMRRIARDQRVHAIQGDADALCKAASAANDAVDAITLLPAARASVALEAISQRYARALKITLRELQDAIKEGREMIANGGVAKAEPSGQPSTGNTASDEVRAPTRDTPATETGASAIG
jgi:eukaryotic-like serine/threonine-protein kinase